MRQLINRNRNNKLNLRANIDKALNTSPLFGAYCCALAVSETMFASLFAYLNERPPHLHVSPARFWYLVFICFCLFVVCWLVGWWGIPWLSSWFVLEGDERRRKMWRELLLFASDAGLWCLRVQQCACVCPCVTCGRWRDGSPTVPFCMGNWYTVQLIDLVHLQCYRRCDWAPAAQWRLEVSNHSPWICVHLHQSSWIEE